MSTDAYCAIINAARKIERNARKYDWWESRVPTDCNSVACMLGWIGFFAGERGVSVSVAVHRVLGIDDYSFYGRMNVIAGVAIHTLRAKDIPHHLRTYAHLYHGRPAFGFGIPEAA